MSSGYSTQILLWEMFSCLLNAVLVGLSVNMPQPQPRGGHETRLKLSQSNTLSPWNLNLNTETTQWHPFIPTVAEREHPFVPDPQIPSVVLVSILSKTPFSSFSSDSGSYPYCDNNSFLWKWELLFVAHNQRPSGHCDPHHGNVVGDTLCRKWLCIVQWRQSYWICPCLFLTETVLALVWRQLA